jgi:CheY-like chemotaxis protein
VPSGVLDVPSVSLDVPKLDRRLRGKPLKGGGIVAESKRRVVSALPKGGRAEAREFARRVGDRGLSGNRRCLTVGSPREPGLTSSHNGKCTKSSRRRVLEEANSTLFTRRGRSPKVRQVRPLPFSQDAVWLLGDDWRTPSEPEHLMEGAPLPALKTVLLVDDQDEIRVTTKWFPTNFGYAVEFVRSAEDALALFDPKIHDVVITDNCPARVAWK